MNINTDQLWLYIKCPMAYLLQEVYGVFMPVGSKDEFMYRLLYQGMVSAVAYMMADKSLYFIRNRWAKTYNSAPKDVREEGLLLKGSRLLKKLYYTQRDWDYVAVRYPYTYTVDDQTALEGFVDCIRSTKEPRKHRRPIQVVSFAQRPIWGPTEDANDVVGVVNRAVFARDLRKELRGYGRTQSVVMHVSTGREYNVRDNLKIRRRTLSYIAGIAVGIRQGVFYPRPQECATCGYSDICDPGWASKRARLVPKKTAEDIRRLLNGNQARRRGSEEHPQ